METSDTVVVGAGVIGCATAFWLARAGLSVTVIERDQLAQHASSASASILAPLDAIGSKPRVTAGWESLEGLREIESELEDVSTIEPRISEAGLLRLADESNLDSMRESALLAEDHGCEWFERAELDAWDARLDPRWIGGLWSPRESHVDGARLTRAFAKGAEHYGARFVFDTAAVGMAMAQGCVAGVLADGDRLFAAGDVVICAGNWSAEVASWIDAAVVYEPVIGEMFKLDAPRPNIPGAVSAGGTQLVPDEGALWASRGLAGTLEAPLAAASEVQRDDDPSLTERVGRILPDVSGGASPTTWVGSYAITPDGMPLLGRVPGVEGAVLATGHGRHGVLLSALTAMGIVELIVEGQISEDAEPFSLERFDD